MIKGLHRLPILIFLLGASLSARSQEKMTLKQAVDLVLQNSRAVDIAKEATVGAEEKIAESKSLYWPQVSVAGSYSRMSLFSEMNISFGGQTFKVRFGLPNNYNMRASVLEQVFNWGRTARTVEISKAGLDLAQDGVAMTKHALAYQIVPLYYGSAFFKEAVKVLDDNIKAFEKKLATANQRYQAGLASSFDVNLLMVQISTIRGQRLDFLNNIDKFRIAFNSLAGRNEMDPFDPAAELIFEPATFDQDSLIKEAQGQRAEFSQLQHQLDLGRASLDLAKTSDKPTVAAGFNYEFRNGYMPDMDKIRGNWTATLSVSYPLFDGNRTGAQVAQAQSNIKSVEMKRADLERLIALEIRSALADLKTIEQKIDIEKIKIRQAEDTLRIAEERFQNGLLSATELIDAQNAVESARLNLLQLIHGHLLGTYNIYRAAGKNIFE